MDQSDDVSEAIHTDALLSSITTLWMGQVHDSADQIVAFIV